ncbi:uncharacterized protein LOC114285257 [Camellia sinensis]|uniref:uncharacterized protein LOC114285257 n=1 Tax=Camellia sinensis TaxID=4442 RepID=UPI001036C728|nr:uncharacterized protein LOC114285257 [Camellia sinensis]
MMMGLRVCELLSAVSFCCFMLLAVAQITDPSEVSALIAMKSNLVDPINHLKNWNKGDPCTSKWRGVLCFDSVTADGYLHVQELYDSRNSILEWSILLIDNSNRSGSMEFVVPPVDASVFFPISVRFTTASTNSELKAANYLNIKSLLDLTCQTVVDMIKGKTPEEIWKTFNIKNDFSADEEEEVRREN